MGVKGFSGLEFRDLGLRGFRVGGLGVSLKSYLDMVGINMSSLGQPCLATRSYIGVVFRCLTKPAG